MSFTAQSLGLSPWARRNIPPFDRPRKEASEPWGHRRQEQQSHKRAQEILSCILPELHSCSFMYFFEAVLRLFHMVWPKPTLLSASPKAEIELIEIPFAPRWAVCDLETHPEILCWCKVSFRATFLLLNCLVTQHDKHNIVFFHKIRRIHLGAYGLVSTGAIPRIPKDWDITWIHVIPGIMVFCGVWFVLGVFDQRGW